VTGADIVARHPRFPAENTVPGTWREPRLFGPSSPSAAGGQIGSNLDRLPSQLPSRPRGNANQRRAGGQGQRTRVPIDGVTHWVASLACSGQQHPLPTVRGIPTWDEQRSRVFAPSRWSTGGGKESSEARPRRVGSPNRAMARAGGGRFLPLFRRSQCQPTLHHSSPSNDFNRGSGPVSPAHPRAHHQTMPPKCVPSC